METPVFEEFDPASDCDCPGCVHWRRVSPRSLPAGLGGHPAAHRTAVVAATAAATPGAGHAVPAPHAPDRPGVPGGDEPDTPQGGKAPRHGPGGRPAQPAGPVTTPETTRADIVRRTDIVRRARDWVSAKVPHPGRGDFGPGADIPYVTRIGRLLVERGGARFSTSGPGPRWSDADRRATRAFQLAQGSRGADADGPPGRGTWALLTAGAGRDIAAAGQGTAATSAGTAGPSAPSPGAAAAAARVPVYPGRAVFRPGADNAYVTQLGRQLVKKGFGTYYTTGPGPRWGEADRRGVEAFQRAQGWRGGAADGCPGPETWRRLFS
ncbi:peptidoglycan-binding protein [Streptomyces sp. NPDC051315]|uniref:peptidoglycan-binding protein n=1 Tax=Streptomyces sp. NPDC051315 TaxID=3365650 RepID=UPI0037BDC630